MSFCQSGAYGWCQEMEALALETTKQAPAFIQGWDNILSYIYIYIYFPNEEEVPGVQPSCGIMKSSPQLSLTD